MYKVHRYSFVTRMAMHRRLLIKDILSLMGIPIANRCLVSEAVKETNKHILQQCEFTQNMVLQSLETTARIKLIDCKN